MIPPFIHQVWTTDRIPDRFAAFRDSWIRHHPDWSYRLWTDADIFAFIEVNEPAMLPVFNAHTRAICRADIARYLILKRYGGLYVDVDFECLRPVGPLLADTELAIGLEPDTHLAMEAVRTRGLHRILCPSFIASAPEHPFWRAVCEALRASQHEPDILAATGSLLLTGAYELLASWDLARDVKLLPATSIYPADKEECWRGRLFDIERWEATTRDAYALHYWDGGWFRGPEHRRTPIEIKLTTTGPEAAATMPSQGRPVGTSPLISCLMVTRDRPTQARLAIECFRAQTYANRELVIVDDSLEGDLALAVAGDARIRIVQPGDPAPILGRARNRAVAEARGDYICQWDDDDLYDPLRLEMQMAALQHAGAQACTLSRWLVWWPNAGRLAISRQRTWEGSLLCQRTVLPAYPELRAGEDTPVLQKLLHSIRMAHLDAPRLYLYIAHGRNTFPPRHFAAHWNTATLQFPQASYNIVLREIGKRITVIAYREILNSISTTD